MTLVALQHAAVPPVIAASSFQNQTANLHKIDHPQQILKITIIFSHQTFPSPSNTKMASTLGIYAGIG